MKIVRQNRNAVARKGACLLALALALALGLRAWAAASDGSSRPAATAHGGSREYVSFKIIPDRNVFNASRSRQISSPAGQPRRPRAEDRLTLVGTMSYEKGAYAFFDGTASEYKTVLETGKAIGGLTLLEVTGGGVTLETATGALALQVGMQLRRDDGGEWLLASSSEARTGSATASTSTSAEAGGSSGEESDLVKRLMQQREQELK